MRCPIRCVVLVQTYERSPLRVELGALDFLSGPPWCAEGIQQGISYRTSQGLDSLACMMYLYPTMVDDCCLKCVAETLVSWLHASLLPPTLSATREIKYVDGRWGNTAHTLTPDCLIDEHVRCPCQMTMLATCVLLNLSEHDCDALVDANTQPPPRCLTNLRLRFAAASI